MPEDHDERFLISQRRLNARRPQKPDEKVAEPPRALPRRRLLAQRPVVRYQGTGAFADSRFHSRPRRERPAASPLRGIHCVTGRYPVTPADPAAQHQSSQSVQPRDRATSQAGPPTAPGVFPRRYAAGRRVCRSLRL